MGAPAMVNATKVLANVIHRGMAWIVLGQCAPTTALATGFATRVWACARAMQDSWVKTVRSACVVVSPNVLVLANAIAVREIVSAFLVVRVPCVSAEPARITAVRVGFVGATVRVLVTRHSLGWLVRSGVAQTTAQTTAHATRAQGCAPAGDLGAEQTAA